MSSQSLHDVSELLNVLVRRTGEPGDLTEMLRHIAQTAQTYFDADTCTIFANNPITGHFIEPNTVINPITGEFIEPYTVAGKLLKYRKEYPRRPSPGGLTERVLKRGILLVEDVETAPEYQSTFTRLEEIRSFVGLALRTSYTQKPLAVLYMNFRQPPKFTANEYELFQIFAYEASFMLQETWLLLRYQEVARIGQEINHEFSTVDILFQKLRENVTNILDTSYALLLAVYQPQTSTLDMYMEEEGHPIVRTNNPLQGACQYVLEKQQTVFIRELGKEAEHQPFQFADLAAGSGLEESLIFVPLVFRDVPLGVLSIQHQEPNAYNLEDLFILQLLANHIALALHNIRLYDNLSRLNETGQLLTQQLVSEQVLQATADKIHGATKADIVVLYPYDSTKRRFMVPPRIAGNLLSSSPQSMSPSRSDDIATLMLHQMEPIFAKEGTIIYTKLHSDLHIQQGNFQEREDIRSTAALPLRVGDVSVGVLFVNFRQTQRFDASQKLLIEGLAHFAAIAIKNAQEYGTLIQRRVRELEILQNIDRELARNLDLNSVLNTLLRLAREHVPAEECSIVLPNVRTQVLEIPAALGRDADVRRATVVPLQETKGITRWVLEEKRPARVDNVHDLPWRDIYLPVTADIVSELDVPLLDDQEVVGILNFESTKEGAFRQEDQDFLLTLAGQGVLAIKNAQAYEREKRLAAEAKALNEISKEITSQLDYVQIFGLILEKALQLTDCTRGNLMLYDPEWNDLWMAAECGVAEEKRGQRQGLDQGIVGYAATHKQLLNVDLSQSPWNEINLDFFPGTCSELAVPLLVGDELRGVLNVESSTPNRFGEGEERLLQGLADLAVIALQNAESYEREKRLAEEGKALNEISKALIGQLDHVRIFDLILEEALELTHSDMGNLMLYDSEWNDLWMAAERGVAEGKKGQRQGLDQGVVGYAATHKQLLNVDLSQSPWNEIYLEFFPGAHSELAVPLLVGNELLGVLNIESFTPNRFSEGDERLLKGLADLAVIALQNTQAREREKRLVAETQILNQISREITSQLDEVYVFNLILEKALELTRSPTGTLEIYNPEWDDLRMAAERGVAEDRKNQRLALGKGVVGYVARHKQLLNVDPSQSPWKEVYVPSILGTRSELAVPMLARNELRGVLNVESPLPNNFTENDERSLQALAQLAVVALQNAERYNKAESAANRSELLYQAGQELGKITEFSQLEQVYDVILNIVQKYCDGYAVISQYKDDTRELIVIRTSFHQDALPSLPKILNGQIVREQRAILIYDMDKPPEDVVLAELSDPRPRSLVATTIEFKERYYGNLELSHKEIGHFGDDDVRFLQGLTQQLASTIYRLETVQARQEAEEMSTIGEIAFSLTHRLDNALGLVGSYIGDIQARLEKLSSTDTVIHTKLENIKRAVRTVLDLSRTLKDALAKSGEAMAGEPVAVSPRMLLEEAYTQVSPSLPANTQICLEVDNDVASVRVIPNLVADILHHLIYNAIQAMPEGGTITLRARNAGHLVALDVVDTGIGIPPQNQDKIFGLFYSTKHSSGFGLWNARRYALKCGGDLKVESQPGQGATFKLLLPRSNGETGDALF